MLRVQPRVWLVFGVLALAAPEVGAEVAGRSQPAVRARKPSVPAAVVARSEPAPARPSARPTVPTKQELLVRYQRVGRALLQLQDQRGRLDCGDLMSRFRAIKLDTAFASIEARMLTDLELSDLAYDIERMRGVQISHACKANPLADGCEAAAQQPSRR